MVRFLSVMIVRSRVPPLAISKLFLLNFHAISSQPVTTIQLWPLSKSKCVMIPSSFLPSPSDHFLPQPLSPLLQSLSKTRFVKADPILLPSPNPIIVCSCLEKSISPDALELCIPVSNRCSFCRSPSVMVCRAFGDCLFDILVFLFCCCSWYRV